MDTEKKLSMNALKRKFKLEVGKTYYGMYFSDIELLAVFKNSM